MNRKRIVATLYREKRAAPFVWGTDDCLFGWAAEGARRIAGTNPAARFKGRYSNFVGLRRAMKNEGFATVGDAAATMAEECAVAELRSGDWATVNDDEGHEGLGLVIGHQIAVRTPEGASHVPLARARRAFRVG